MRSFVEVRATSVNVLYQSVLNKLSIKLYGCDHSLSSLLHPLMISTKEIWPERSSVTSVNNFVSSQFSCTSFNNFPVPLTTIAYICIRSNLRRVVVEHNSNLINSDHQLFLPYHPTQGSAAHAM